MGCLIAQDTSKKIHCVALNECIASLKREGGALHVVLLWMNSDSDVKIICATFAFDYSTHSVNCMTLTIALERIQNKWFKAASIIKISIWCGWGGCMGSNIVRRAHIKERRRIMMTCCFLNRRNLRVQEFTL